MKKNRTYHFTIGSLVKSKITDYKLLTKFGLTTSVVISALFGYLMSSTADTLIWTNVFLITIAGYLVTGASNALNQIIEKDTDRLMKRTADRPLPTGRMSSTEALLFAGVSGLIGILMLWYFFNVNAALVGALSLFSYSFIYTPLKKVTPISVLVGAFPGAFPVVIGFLAANGGVFTYDIFYLFAIQFIWQFPHFWSIAWISDTDYRNAGFNLLPTKEGKTKSVAVLSLFYIISLLLLSVYYSVVTQMHYSTILIVALIGLFFVCRGFQFLRHTDDFFAKKLMIASIIYLPILQILYSLNKLL